MKNMSYTDLAKIVVDGYIKKHPFTFVTICLNEPKIKFYINKETAIRKGNILININPSFSEHTVLENGSMSLIGVLQHVKNTKKLVKLMIYLGIGVDTSNISEDTFIGKAIFVDSTHGYLPY